MNETVLLCPVRTQTVQGPSAGAGKHLAALARAGIVVALLASSAGCVARPIGDFGRAAPDFIHDEAMPVVGKWRAKAGGEPVSSFNLTDQEDEMHNRVWRFLVSPHANDWFHDAATELQRTRIAGQVDGKFRSDRYYNWLSSTRYQSSRVRYSTVQQDVETDIATVPDTFAAICAVIEVDRQRAIAGSAIHGGSATAQAEVTGRKAENDMFIGWFVRALRYRYDSYNFALDGLLVETPHEEAKTVDARLSELAIYVHQAESGNFCGGSGGEGYLGGETSLPSRVLMSRDKEVVYQK
jgi:hypothetical protein